MDMLDRITYYRFLTTWCLSAPTEQVWDALYDTSNWPQWWRGVESVTRLEKGDDNGGVGSLSRYIWKSRLPYQLCFDMRVTRVDPPYLLEGNAIGELTGLGRWRLFSGKHTAVIYEWNVKTTTQWMNLAAPFARPIFAWNHNWVMHQGGKGLARLLGAKLLVSS
jgi:hypothetical protein